MIGLDTNVLVRYFAQDDAAQAELASQLIDGLTEAAPGYVSTAALMETWWVLCRTPGLDRDDATIAVFGLLDAKEIIVENAEQVRWAMRRVANGADFADALIGEAGRAAGCEHTMTFDRKAAAHAGMRLLENASLVGGRPG